MTVKNRHILVCSDSTGGTAEKVLRAALSCFDSTGVEVEVRSHLRDPGDFDALVELAEERESLVVHTMVNPEARAQLHALCDEAGVDDIDMLGWIMARLQTFLGTEPSVEPGSLHRVSDDYFKRVEALEFAIKHDDGHHPRSLAKADIVLVGISRTGKTPLAAFLAQRGLKVANIPVVQGVEPPPALFEIDQERVYGLTIHPDVLARLRQARLARLSADSQAPSYGMKTFIEQELSYARDLFAQNPTWPVLDVTDKAVEDIAATILSIHAGRLAARAASEG